MRCHLYLLALAIWLLLAVPAVAQTFEIATDQSPVGLDPHVATAFSTQLIDGNIYEGLTAIDAGLRTIPSLAESWTVSADGQSYRFALRPGALFHNGQPVTPADVMASIARVRDPKTGSPYASRFADISGVESDGDTAVRITLRQPSAPFLSQLASLAIVPATATAGLARQPIGTGPFRFRQWVPDTSITLDRFDGYWQKGLPHLQTLKFNIVPEAATRQLGLAGGAYRMLPSIDAATAKAVQSDPRLRLLQTQDLAYSLVGFNTSKPPFDNPQVREAVNLGIDRGQIADAAYYGQATPAGPLSPALAAWALPTTAFPCYRPDPEKAKALLAQAGLTMPVKLTLNVLGSLQLVVDVAQVVQAQLNKAGFDVTLNVQEQGKFIQDWRASNFQGFVSLNGGGTDPDDYFGRTFQTGGATNVFRFSDPALDTRLNTARSTEDPVLRKQIYDEVQTRLACQGPAVHLAYGTLFTAVSADMKGYEMLATRSTRGLREATFGK